MLPQAVHDALLGHQTLLWWLAVTSVLACIGTLTLVPLLLVRLPTDYFAHGKRHPAPWGHHHPLIRGILLVGKNIVGALFLLAGLIMLFLPGQGLLTMVMGIILLDLPGKYRFERWLISHRPILHGINWLRLRAGKPLLILGKENAPDSPTPP